MKFIPCIELSIYDSAHCGRSHEETAETKVLVTSIVNFVEKQDYDNVEEYL